MNFNKNIKQVSCVKVANLMVCCKHCFGRLCMRVASRVAERLKTYDLRKLGNSRKISNLGGHIA